VPVRLTRSILAAAVLLTACGTGTADDGSAPTTSTTAASDAPCGALTVEAVSAALGRPASLVGTEEGACAFEAGTWALSVQLEAGASELPPSVSVTNDRSGYWLANGSVVAGGVLHVFTLRNQATGSDTYPPAAGPAQRPVTEAAAGAVVQAIEERGA
jgi:hypothetical protein